MANSSSLLFEARCLREVVRCSLADEDPCQGGSHKVFKIVFKDSVQWAARVCHDPDNWKYELRAVKMFQHIKQSHPDIKAPGVLFKAEHPVLYSEWVSGEPLAVWNSQIPLNKRQRLLEDLAEFLLQLWTTAAPPLILSQSQSPDYAGEYDKYTDVGFAHGDLNTYNIMKGDHFHLTGVIDWDWISLAPLPAVIHHPWFIADIPGWRNNGLAEGESFGDDRCFLENAIKAKETSQQLPDTVSTLLRDSGRRLFFQSAFYIKGIYEKFVKMHCTRIEENIKAATLQLDAVLSLYPEWSEVEGVHRIKGKLDEYYIR
ncbi:hypothetical protein ANOM_006109 [Aspergillus nomiae NRRL 13137]|uniref:Aminoglycoside phosphotransferase domain-containing protein n=1 Tax=Aspergillus nomiae NRRL (strain ATCC 15546 / NRRL 13137 / CBS 260.88 / M93) TaxID=1509407 RepID=A0A0L1J2E8_ASPN3|nr:uncharacterized protein ANOM_006109 [Aspergillus nomiae NRRL 13137]KNG85966.1 hypothetical protein ANOM_006109 [Aspergillus nomiae NRRL 13137]